jgi:serine/threonine protein phosphatase PrpC
MSHEITAEFSKEELAASPPPLMFKIHLTIACKTDLGRVRENNEDKFEYYISEDEHTLALRGSIFVMCDGMGGHSAGQIASELTCKTFIDVYLHHASTEPEIAAREAVRAANRYVLDVGRSIPARRGMGTTLSALIIWQDKAITVQVGDSRIYVYHDNELIQLTHDHTVAEEQVRLGIIDEEEAARHPNAHVLTRAVGVEDIVEPDIELHNLGEGYIYILCSDGLTNHVPDDKIADIISKYPPSESAWKLVNSALLDGGSDNCSVIIVRVDKIEKLN